MKANRKSIDADDAVSPVIAVILMVAITVVLAATVYLWVSGFGANQRQLVNASFGAKAIDHPNGETDDNVDDAIELTLASADEDLQNTDITVSVDGLLLTWTSPYFLQGPAWAAGELCTSDPGLDGDAVWERGASVILIEGEAGADAGAAGCDTTPAAVGNLGDLDGIHTIKVSVKGQVVLDTSIEVHDDAGA